MQGTNTQNKHLAKYHTLKVSEVKYSQSQFQTSSGTSAAGCLMHPPLIEMFESICGVYNDGCDIVHWVACLQLILS